MVQVLTAIVGGYDQPKQHAPQSIDCTFTTLTDLPGDDPRRAAKEPKLSPWAFTGPGPWVWLDGSVQITSKTFVEEALDVTDGPLGMWEHPLRDCIYDEAQTCAESPRIAHLDTVAQANHYRREGHPERWGLWATGIMVFRERCDELARRWMHEIDRWTTRDQISLPVVLRELGIRPASFPNGQYRNPWVRVHPHRRRR